MVCRRAETERHSQAKDNVHGWISHIICLCFLSSFITSRIKTNPVTRESATTSPHLVFGQEDRGVFRVGGGGRGRDLLSPGQFDPHALPLNLTGASGSA